MPLLWQDGRGHLLRARLRRLRHLSLKYPEFDFGLALRRDAALLGESGLELGEKLAYLVKMHGNINWPAVFTVRPILLRKDLKDLSRRANLCKKSLEETGMSVEHMWSRIRTMGVLLYKPDAL